jgi:hypothetical protein
MHVHIVDFCCTFYFADDILKVLNDSKSLLKNNDSDEDMIIQHILEVLENVDFAWIKIKRNLNYLKLQKISQHFLFKDIPVCTSITCYYDIHFFLL